MNTPSLARADTALSHIALAYESLRAELSEMRGGAGAAPPVPVTPDTTPALGGDGGAAPGPVQPAPVPVPAGPPPTPATYNTLSFHIGPAAGGAGGVVYLTGNGRIIDTITVGAASEEKTYTGPRVAAPVRFVYANEGPGKDAGVGQFIWNDVLQPEYTAWFKHDNDTLLVTDPTQAPVVVPPVPVIVTPVPLTRPAEISDAGRKPQPLTNIADHMELVLISPGDSLQDALNRIDPGKWPVLRLAPGNYIGDQLFHDYLNRPAIFEAADPLVMPRLTLGAKAPFNGKSLFDVACAGDTRFLNLELFHNQNVGSGDRDNICAISVEGGVVGRIDVMIGGCLGYDNGNMAGRGSPETYWKIVGTVATQNGIGGEGYSHAMYLLGAWVEMTDCTFMDTQMGHDFKSRCLGGRIIRCTFRDGPLGTSSYRVDLPDGGKWYFEDTILDTGPNSVNGTALHFGGEIATEFHPDSSLTMVRTLFENSRKDTPIAIKNDRPDMVVPVISGTRAWGGYDAATMYQDGRTGANPDTGVVILTERPADPVPV